MALNVLTLLPSLYHVQKALENYTLKYGSTVYLDPNDDPRAKVKPSISKNENLFKTISRNLIAYYHGKVAIRNEWDSKKSAADTYFGLLTTVLTIVIILAIVFVFAPWAYGGFFADYIPDIASLDLNGVKKWWTEMVQSYKSLYYVINPDDGKAESVPLSACILALFIILLFLCLGYMLYFTVKLWQNTTQNNARLYNLVNHVESDEVQKVVHLFQVQDMDNDGIFLENARPTIAYTYAVNNPNIQVVIDKQTPDQDIREYLGSNVNSPNPIETMKAFLSRTNDNKQVYPFSVNDNTKPPWIDPFLLKNQIQSMDLYGQLDRIAAAMAYLKGFMMRSTDDVYSNIPSTITAEARKSLQAAIADGILNGCTVVGDLAAGAVGAGGGNQSTCQDCFAAAMDSVKYVGASFNPATSNCTLIGTASNGVQDAIVYTGPNSYMTLIKNTGSFIGITSSTMGTASNFTGVCGSNSEGCIVVAGGSTYSNYIAPGATYKTALKPSAGAAPVLTTCAVGQGDCSPGYSYPSSGTGLTFYTSASNIVSQGADKAQARLKSVVVAVTTLKTWTVNNIVQTIIATDTTNTFTMDQNDANAIIAIIQKAVGNSYSQISGPLTDVLTEVPFVLAQKMNDATLGVKTGGVQYIPFERFQGKIGAMDSRAFVTSFVYNLDEVRATSHGISDLYVRYGMSGANLQFYKEMRERGLDWLMGGLILGWAIVGIWMCKKAGAEINALKPEEPLPAKKDEPTQCPPTGDPACLAALMNVGANVLGLEGVGTTDEHSNKPANGGAKEIKGKQDILDNFKTFIENYEKNISIDTLFPNYYQANKKDFDENLLQTNEDYKLLTSVPVINDKSRPINTIVSYVVFLDKMRRYLIRTKLPIKNYENIFSKILDFLKETLKSDSDLERQKTILIILEKIKHPYDPNILFNSHIEIQKNNTLDDHSRTKTLESVDQASQNEENKSKASIIIKHATNFLFITCGMLVLFFMLKYTHDTKSATEKYDLSTMEQNASTLTTDSQQCIESLYSDMIANDYFGIKKSTSPNALPNPYVSETLIIDPYGTANTTAEPRIDKVFDTIVVGSTVSSSVKLKVDNRAALDMLYNNIIEMITAYDKCNSIFALQGERLPFPVMELTLYLIVIAVALVALYIVGEQLNGFENPKEASDLQRDANILMKLDGNGEIPKPNLPEAARVNKWHDKLPFKGKGMTEFVKLGGCAVIIVLTVLFIVQLQKDGSMYAGSLQSNFGATQDCSSTI
jgi:hypothetical protein